MFYVSLNWITLIIGGRDSSRSRQGLDSILLYDTERDTWQSAGNMTVRRAFHAVAVFPDVSQLCPWWSGGLDFNARAREGRIFSLIALYLLIFLCRTVNIIKYQHSYSRKPWWSESKKSFIITVSGGHHHHGQQVEDGHLCQQYLLYIIFNFSV